MQAMEPDKLRRFSETLEAFSEFLVTIEKGFHRFSFLATCLVPSRVSSQGIERAQGVLREGGDCDGARAAEGPRGRCAGVF